ncbi:hypothetical protein [Ralstonia pseudosolanacearum]|uniref:hypothetical protein n=1 Tax=Ralstonia pseudosolanacearum TaxID=1310165 RepID=UPI00405463EA
MSQAQERRRAEAWETQHKESHEKSIRELQEIQTRLKALDQSSLEYAKLKAEYDEKRQAAEEFFMKYYES